MTVRSAAVATGTSWWPLRRARSPIEDEAARARVSNYIRTKLPVAGPLARTRDGRVEVYIPGGSFLRGCEGTREEHPECEEDEFPAKTIRMSGFWMGATEVTQKDYEWALRKEPGAFRVKGNPSYSKGSDSLRSE